jgi:hypothetical protein
LAVRVSVCCPTTVENGENILPVPGFLDDLEEKDVYLVIKSNFVRNPQVLEIRRLIKKSFFDKKDWLVR